LSFQKSTTALKNEVLEICGELTDGTSDYESAAVKYLNDLYQGVLAGGNEFGVEVAEPWVWAQSKRPMPLSLDPVYSAAALLTEGSFAGVFTVAPTISLKGRYLRVDARSDIYRIIQHAAGETGFQIDQNYLDDTGTLNVMCYKLDYDLIDELIIIDGSNKYIDFKEAALGSPVTATLSEGAYTPSSLATAVKTAMELAGAETYTVSFNELTRKFTVAHGGAHLDLLFASGSNAYASASLPLGFDVEDQSGFTSYTGAYSNSGILRLTKPITMYRDQNFEWGSAKDSGKIFHVDANTFLRDYPMNRIQQEVPTRFTLVSQDPYGLTKARFNASVLENPIRVEVNYIPVTRKLVDNSASIPIVPGSYSKYLVYGASHFIMLDKSDNRAGEYQGKAVAKLNAMINDNRKTSQAAGIDFGRLTPRRGQWRPFGYSR
jgi:hypothetical protein